MDEDVATGLARDAVSDKRRGGIVRRNVGPVRGDYQRTAGRSRAPRGDGFVVEQVGVGNDHTGALGNAGRGEERVELSGANEDLAHFVADVHPALLHADNVLPHELVAAQGYPLAHRRAADERGGDDQGERTNNGQDEQSSHYPLSSQPSGEQRVNKRKKRPARRLPPVAPLDRSVNETHKV